ncbi:uncharacterized protein LOC114322529 isoform X1 [Camellia sinensis]|uniref:uncharacterized protein LOC114322529 isoform X1 n=1 Tax=Camellia sinensis TaxID=4442 RepID=UPI001036627B|nr:uncharacterized protein LOC114322529 isoform X1 [Camellia sinensis]
MSSTSKINIINLYILFLRICIFDCIILLKKTPNSYQNNREHNITERVDREREVDIQAERHRQKPWKPWELLWAANLHGIHFHGGHRHLNALSATLHHHCQLPTSLLITAFSSTPPLVHPSLFHFLETALSEPGRFSILQVKATSSEESSPPVDAGKLFSDLKEKVRSKPGTIPKKRKLETISQFVFPLLSVTTSFDLSLY